MDFPQAGIGPTEIPRIENTIVQFEALIRRDPARRGLIGSEPRFGPLCPGDLAAASADLAQFGSRVGIITGFYIPRGSPPAAETDGPLGSLLLAAALEGVGMETFLLTDRHCLSAVRATARAMNFDLDRVQELPHDSAAAREEFFLQGLGRLLTHLIAVERVGPSHTPETLARQQRPAPPPLERFAAQVGQASHGRCHKMRGEPIDEYTANAHSLFEDAGRLRPAMKSIGIGDGGNEIGMGRILWEELERRLSGEQAGRIPCHVATDWNIVAGTSNWGAYALAAATLLHRDETEILRPYGREHQHEVLHALVTHGPAVDGVTLRREATVDGLPFLTYIQPWEGIRRLLGFAD